VLPLPLPLRTNRCAAAMAEADNAEDLLPLLADSHAHPQLDVANLNSTVGLRVPCVAAMGVAANVDWGTMERLAELAGVMAGCSVLLVGW
jgi:hypothetical protein